MHRAAAELASSAVRWKPSRIQAACVGPARRTMSEGRAVGLAYLRHDRCPAFDGVFESSREHLRTRHHALLDPADSRAHSSGRAVHERTTRGEESSAPVAVPGPISTPTLCA